MKKVLKLKKNYKGGKKTLNFVSVRVRNIEYAKLTQMSDHYGQSKSSFLRYLINKDYSKMLDQEIIKEVNINQ